MIGGRRAARQAGPPVVAPKPSPPARRLTNGGDEADSPKPAVKSRRRRRRRGGAARVPTRAIVFVGPMAAGKTSLGKRVAKELAIPFVDSDVLFVKEHGPIAEFFTQNGEAEFRRIEAEIISRELAQEGTRILALGGGAILNEETRKLLAKHPTILLMTTQEAVLRTANISRRPLLKNDPTSWNRILQERKPLYREVADVTFRTDRAGKEQLTQRVVLWVRAYARKERSAARRAQQPTENELE